MLNNFFLLYSLFCLSSSFGNLGYLILIFKAVENVGYRVNHMRITPELIILLLLRWYKFQRCTCSEFHGEWSGELLAHLLSIKAISRCVQFVSVATAHAPAKITALMLLMHTTPKILVTAAHWRSLMLSSRIATTSFVVEVLLSVSLMLLLMLIPEIASMTTIIVWHSIELLLWSSIEGAAAHVWITLMMLMHFTFIIWN